MNETNPALPPPNPVVPPVQPNVTPPIQNATNISSILPPTNNTGGIQNIGVIQNTTGMQNTSTHIESLGMVVTPPTLPPQMDVLPGILIYPKRTKQRKRDAQDDSKLVDSGFQVDISSILKGLDITTPGNVGVSII